MDSDCEFGKNKSIREQVSEEVAQDLVQGTYSNTVHSFILAYIDFYQVRIINILSELSHCFPFFSSVSFAVIVSEDYLQSEQWF